MPKALSILFGTGLSVLLCWLCGRIVLRWCKLPLGRAEENLFAYAAGAAVYSNLLFLLASLRLVYDATFLVLAVLLGAAAWWSGALRPSGHVLPPAPRLWNVLLYAGMAAFGIWYVVHAMAPEMSPDGSSYHLSVVGRYYREHGFVKLTSNMYANLSQGMDILFLGAYAFGRHSAAALFHASFLFALPLLMAVFGRRFEHPRAGVVGALLFFISPVAGIDGASAYNDIALAFCLFAMFYSLLLWRRTRLTPLLVLAGLLAGYAFAIKYTAFLALPFAFAVAASTIIRSRPLRFQPLGAFVLAGCFCVLPWLVRNSIWFGNPVSPLANELFPNPYIHISFESDYRAGMRFYRELKSYAQIPWETCVRGGILGGFLGPVFLSLPVALLALRYPVGRMLLLAALVFALPYVANVGTRFLIPAAPFFSLALALAVESWAPLLLGLAVLHGALSWPEISKQYCDPYAWRIVRLPWKAALRIQPELDYLNEYWPPFRIARMVEDKTPRGSVIFAPSPFADAYTTREVRVGFQSASNELLLDVFHAAMIRDRQAVRRYEFTFPQKTVQRIRVTQTAAHIPDQWSVHEMRVGRQGREMPRTLEWRIRSNPNPWDVGLAFDASLYTRWRTWQPARPGMYVELDFGRPTEVDTIQLDASGDQYAVRLRAQYYDARTGNWQNLDARAAEYGLPPPLEARLAAMREMKRAGVTHVLISQPDFGFEDLRQKQELWGVEAVGELEGVVLYRIR